MESSVVDEVFNNEYFKINKRLLVACGLWSYSSKFGNLIKRIFIAILLSFGLFSHANAIRVWCAKDLGAENIAGTVYTTGFLINYLVTIFKENKMAKIYELLASTWSSITDTEEKKIMLENAKIGKLKTIGCVGHLTIAGVVFTQTGIIPTVLDFIMPLNESRSQIKMEHAEYIIDQDGYFFEIYYFYCVVGFLSTGVLMCIDTMYTVVVHQNLAIFCIIKYRLHLAMANPDKGLPKENGYAYNTIISAIRLHQEAIEYSNKWYHVSPRAKVLLQIMMLRCMKPCCLSAAGLYVMNFENYAAIIKTTMSYITVQA